MTGGQNEPVDEFAAVTTKCIEVQDGHDVREGESLTGVPTPATTAHLDAPATQGFRYGRKFCITFHVRPTSRVMADASE
jgi:hypothetical protein